jgi:hypothetical protein
MEEQAMELPRFPVPVMWHQDGRLISRSEGHEDPNAEYFSKEQLIDFAIDYERLRRETLVEARPIETAPHDRDALVFNDLYGWYRSRATVINLRVYWPLHMEGGVWYPVPSHWMELPSVPAGRKWYGVSTMPRASDPRAVGAEDKTNG